MTYKEKFKADHPEMSAEELCEYIDETCPRIGEYVLAVEPDYCGETYSCERCWDREIPEGRGETGVSTIKDSGDRTQFDTGAVRDMREGKGRCDLMPLEVVSRMFTENPHVEDPILRDIRAFQNSRNSDYLYRALVEFCNKQYSGFCSSMLLEVAKHFEDGAKKYGPDNWRRGIPVYCYIDSAVRHYLKWLRGDKDEPHDRAFVWNIMCCIWEVDYHKEETND